MALAGFRNRFPAPVTSDACGGVSRGVSGVDGRGDSRVIGGRQHRGLRHAWKTSSLIKYRGTPLEPGVASCARRRTFT